VSGAIVEHSSDAIFAKELCGLLASLEAVSPGYGKDILRLSGAGFGGLNHEGGELSKEGNYQGQKKKEGRRKKSFGGCLTAPWVMSFVVLLCVMVPFVLFRGCRLQVLS
jgi:hypothetical protein